MRHFDRIDWCEAHYAFASDWHDGQGSEIYQIFGMLKKMPFSPPLSVREKGKEGLTDNGLSIYYELRKKYHNPNDNFISYGNVSVFVGEQGKENVYDRWLREDLEKRQSEFMWMILSGDTNE